MLKESSDGRWISRSYLNDNSEAHYLMENEKNSNLLIPDRSFIENNIQWVIDYKIPFQPIKNLMIEAKKHHSQLNMYENIFSKNSLVVRKAIYFAPQGKLITL